jgi:hypothetical protein
MKTTQKNVWNNSRSSEKQGGKGEHRTDTTPKPEIGKKQREQQQGAKQAKPNSCTESPTSHEPVGLSFFVAFYCD